MVGVEAAKGRVSYGSACLAPMPPLEAGALPEDPASRLIPALQLRSAKNMASATSGIASHGQMAPRRTDVPGRSAGCGSPMGARVTAAAQLRQSGIQPPNV